MGWRERVAATATSTADKSRASLYRERRSRSPVTGSPATPRLTYHRPAPTRTSPPPLLANPVFSETKDDSAKSLGKEVDSVNVAKKAWKMRVAAEANGRDERNRAIDDILKMGFNQDLRRTRELQDSPVQRKILEARKKKEKEKLEKLAASETASTAIVPFEPSKRNRTKGKATRQRSSIDSSIGADSNTAEEPQRAPSPKVMPRDEVLRRKKLAARRAERMAREQLAMERNKKYQENPDYDGVEHATEAAEADGAGDDASSQGQEDANDPPIVNLGELGTLDEIVITDQPMPVNPVYGCLKCWAGLLPCCGDSPVSLIRMCPCIPCPCCGCCWLSSLPCCPCLACDLDCVNPVPKRGKYYSVFDSSDLNMSMGSCVEESSAFYRVLLGTQRELNLDLRDSKKQTLVQFYRPLRSTRLPVYRQEMAIYMPNGDGRIGRVLADYTPGCQDHFTVFLGEDEESEEPYGKITIKNYKMYNFVRRTVPMAYSFMKPKPPTFEFHTLDGEFKGEIVCKIRRRETICTKFSFTVYQSWRLSIDPNRDTFTLGFADGCTDEDRAALMAAAFLIDYMYYEGATPSYLL